MSVLLMSPFFWEGLMEQELSMENHYLYSEFLYG